MTNYVDYDGWGLNFFDEAINFRNYQIDIIKKYIIINASGGKYYGY